MFSRRIQQAAELGLECLLQFWVNHKPSTDRSFSIASSAMKCPFCGFANDKVVDSRESKEAESIRRRRECLKCGKRFTTYERIDEIPYMVVKKDGRREKFDRQKVLNGLLRACEKRPVPISKLEQIVNEAESCVIDYHERERKTSELGELIMNRLRRYDKVAYVRFASVYLDFKDVNEFMNELRDLVKAKEAGEARVKSPKA
jgi:transcriptional repressor NrdR